MPGNDAALLLALRHVDGFDPAQALGLRDEYRGQYWLNETDDHIELT